MRNSELKPRQFNEALYGFDDIKDYTKTAKDIGINTLGDLQRFKKEAPIEGVASESDMEELKKYKDKLGQNFEIKNEEFNLDEALGIAEQLKESTKSDSDLEKLIDDATEEYFTNVDPYAFNNNPFDTDRELMSSFKNDLHNIRYVRELIKEYSGVKECTKFVRILYQIESELLPPKPSYLGNEDDYNESLKEEYGPYKDEPYCEEIADRLEDGFWEGCTNNDICWELDINGLHRSDFTPAFADWLAENVSYPVRDGHLSYMSLDILLSKTSIPGFVDSDTAEKLIPDLVTLGVDRAFIDSWLKDQDEYAELEFWIDYDTNFDADAWDTENNLPNLPSEVEVSIYDVDYVEGETDPEELSDTLSDYLSDTYGYTHFGFDFDVEGDTIYIYNIKWDLNEKLNENIIKITSKNLKDFYLKPTGNIYYKDPDMKSFEIVDDFSEQDILNAMQNGVIFVYKEGPASNFIDEKLIQSSSKDALQKNIKTEIKSGKDPKQAAAIAYSVKEKNEDLTQDMLNDLEDRDINFEKDKEAERQAKVELAKNGVETDPLNEDDDFGSTDGWNI